MLSLNPGFPQYWLWTTTFITLWLPSTTGALLKLSIASFDDSNSSMQNSFDNVILHSYV
jgi:hypothetical protein